MRAIPGGPLLAALLAVLAGCGYAFGTQTFGASVRTVAVRVAGNATFRQRIEADLTRELRNQMSDYSDLRPASFTTADAVLEVAIDQITGRRLVGDRQQPVREGVLDFDVSIRLIDNRTGALIRDRHRIDRAEFRSAIGEDETSATAEAVSDLARKILLALEGDI